MFLISVGASPIERVKRKQIYDYSNGGEIQISGVIKRNLYISPENTFMFQLPELEKPGFKLFDETDGVELMLTISDVSGYYTRIDVFNSKGMNDIERWHKENSSATRGDYLVEKYIDGVEFDLFKSSKKVDIYMTVSDLENKSNGYQVTGMILSEGKVYMVTTVVNVNVSSSHPRGADILGDMLHEKFQKEIGESDHEVESLTDKEKIDQAKEIILTVISNLYVWPKGTY